MPEKQFWRTKLAALLHDPPDKCLNIVDHQQDAARFQAGAGLALTEMFDTWAVNAADVFTAAADRFSFPKGKCGTYYNELPEAEFKHPLSTAGIDLELPQLRNKSGAIHAILQSAINGIDTEDPRTALFLYWRRWLENAVLSNSDLSKNLAFLPADTRIPDHTIWQHNAMASALAGCVVGSQLRPAMLLFQLGGVQEFISQARTTSDLWSGSYLLSWLMAAAMKAISDEVGPDAIVFPNLRGNGIFDAMHKDTMYAVMYADKEGKQKSLWERMREGKQRYDIKSQQQRGRQKQKNKSDADVQWLTTPTLPNRFLAIVPENRAAQLAQKAAAAITEELTNIGEAVWKWLVKEAKEAGCSGLEQWKQRWDAQLLAFPQVSWAVQPWLKRDECLRKFAELPVNQTRQNKNISTDDCKTADSPLETLTKTLQLAEEWGDSTRRDPRYYKKVNGKDVLNNDGVLWSAHYALLDAKLAARRNTRNFPAWKNPWPEASLKDSLSGKEEVIGDKKFWDHLDEKYGRSEDRSQDHGRTLLFTADGHKYGAMNLIKRLWCKSSAVDYLQQRLGLNANEFSAGMGFASTQDMAKNNQGQSKYIALLAMDGDEMGKWVSGQMTPKFIDQLSEQAREVLEPILKANNSVDLRRLLSPSYHLQFSETLANFATWLARPVVENYGGQLIYAGGDDVLAMLPATRAIDCARALRAVFRCEKPDDMAQMELDVNPGCYVNAGAGYPLLVPGERADVSVGLAIGHVKAPLQMLVQEAQNAEKRAKQQYGRGAIAFSLYKRSGEIIKWGCKWDSKALKLMKEISRLDVENVPPNAVDDTTTSSEKPGCLSERFPYALAAFLQPYQLHKPLTIDVETMRQIISREVGHVLSRQGKNLTKQDKLILLETIQQWLTECVNRTEALLSSERPASGRSDAVAQPLADFIQPFLTEAFIYRDHGGEA